MEKVVGEVNYEPWGAHHLANETDEVHVVFNNNARDFAPKAAERLRKRLGQSIRCAAAPLKQGGLL